MRELSDFSSQDGHIESVVVGVGQVKVSFQTWNCVELVLIFDDVVEIHNIPTMTDIGDFSVIPTEIEIEDRLEKDFFLYTFLGSWDNDPILCITAKSMKIYEVGYAFSNDTALFDVGRDYVGKQRLSG